MIDLYIGALLTKRRSGRVAQVAGLDEEHVWLTWDDNDAQTIVKRKRFKRESEWEPLVYYQEEQAGWSKEAVLRILTKTDRAALASAIRGEGRS